jgi:hypothetical protein
MMRIARWLSLILVLTVFAGTEARANTHTAASCSAFDVQAAINSASNGDTVLVPGGTCTWSTSAQVTISSSKQITLNGQGNTTINFGNSGVQSTGTALTVTAGTSANTFVTGFIFNGAFINGACPINLNTAFSPMTQAFRFYGNTLSYTGGSAAGTMICINGNGPGLLDHNSFTTDRGASELIHNLGEGPAGQSSWSEDVVPGGPVAIFFEDNTFSYPVSANNYGTSAIQNYYGARTVFRYNHITNQQFDVHGTNLSPGACTVANGRWFEVYNNDFHTYGATSNVYVWFAIRGGSGVVFNNTSIGTNLGSGAINLTSDCQGGSYPVQDQVGRGIGQNASPLYLWNNLNTTTSKAMGFVDGEGTNLVQANRDFLASGSQPGSITRCESAADVATGCPVSYAYKPYTYPHPLTLGTQTSVAPPTNLTGTVQ